MMTVPIRSAPSLEVGKPRPLFKLKQGGILLEVSRHERFLLLMPTTRAAERRIIVSTPPVGGLR
jgi:hypothetical protein